MSGGTNPVAAYAQTNFTVDTATVYKTKIDSNFIAIQRIVDTFAPRQTTVPAMTVSLDPGHIFNGVTLTEVATQTTGTITAPVGNPRIDRVVVDRFTGTVSVITGTPNASPVPPAITSGTVPICQVLLQTTSTSITNSMITDERDLTLLGGTGNNIPWAVAGGTVNAITASYTPANTSLTDGLILSVRISGANTSTTPTFAPDGLTAHTITKCGGVALLPGDLPNNLAEVLLRYNLSNTRWELMNPAAQFIPWAVAGGTVNAITATYTPANATLYDGLLLSIRATGANSSTTPTFAPDGLTAHTITKNGGAALAIGDIAGNLAESLLRYNLANTRWELLNPAVPTVSGSYLRRTIYQSGTGTWSPGTGTNTIIAKLWGAGGGTSGDGGDTTFDTLTAHGGKNAGSTAPPAGGTATGGDLNYTGGYAAIQNASNIGGFGGAGAGGGGPTGVEGKNGLAPGGAAGPTAGSGAYGGGGGAYCEKRYTSPVSASYAVGAGGTGTLTGGAGQIIIEEYS